MLSEGATMLSQTPQMLSEGARMLSLTLQISSEGATMLSEGANDVSQTFDQFLLNSTVINRGTLNFAVEH